MSWHGLEGHDLWVERFRRAVAQGRLAHAFLFVGPEGIGKRRFALLVAKALLCQKHAPEELNPCHDCRSCLLIEAGSHPDLFVVAKPEDKSEFPVELLIGDREHRGQEGACRALALKPVLGARRILIIDDADYLNPESANALLKTIEEPPPGALIILIATSAARQLPTIRSRCQLVQFRALPREAVTRKLLELGYVQSEAQASKIADMAGGSIGRAITLVELDVLRLREEVASALKGLPQSLPTLLEKMLQFAEKGSSSAEAKARVRLLFEWVAEDLREYLRVNRLPSQANQSSQRQPDSTTPAGKTAPTNGLWCLRAEQLLVALDVTLGLADLLDRNVNRTCLLQAWLQRLAEIASSYSPG